MRSSVTLSLKNACSSRSPLSSQSFRAAALRNQQRLHTAAIPDFLLPSFQAQSVTFAPTHLTITSSRQTVRPPKAQARHFSTSPPRRDVNVTANLRKDEDGNDMVVDITPRAANRLQEIMNQDSNPSLALRVTVQSGGCHGFQYLMSLVSDKEASAEDDTIFEATDGSGAKVVMDEPSLELLKGSKIDYTMELIGSQFKIVGNPAATSSCGCGTSFDIKM